MAWGTLKLDDEVANMMAPHWADYAAKQQAPAEAPDLLEGIRQKEKELTAQQANRETELRTREQALHQAQADGEIEKRSAEPAIAIGQLFGGLGGAISGKGAAGAQHVAEMRRRQIADSVVARIKSQQEQFNNDRLLSQNATQFGHQNLQSDIALGQLGETQRRNSVDEGRASETARKAKDAEARLAAPADEAQQSLLVGQGGLKPEIAAKMTYGEAEKLLGPLMSNHTQGLRVQIGSDPANMTLKNNKFLEAATNRFDNSLNPEKNPNMRRWSDQLVRVKKGLGVALDANGNPQDLPKESLQALKSDVASLFGGGVPTEGQLRELSSHTAVGDVAKWKTFFTGDPEKFGNKEYARLYSELLKSLGGEAEKAIKKQQISEVAKGGVLRRMSQQDHDNVLAGHGLNPAYVNAKGQYVEPPLQPAALKPSGKVTVSNGKRTLLIDAADLKDAAADGFKQVGP